VYFFFYPLRENVSKYFTVFSQFFPFGVAYYSFLFFGARYLNDEEIARIFVELEREEEEE
jgi:hypothetical protein